MFEEFSSDDIERFGIRIRTGIPPAESPFQTGVFWALLLAVDVDDNQLSNVNLCYSDSSCDLLLSGDWH